MEFLKVSLIFMMTGLCNINAMDLQSLDEDSFAYIPNEIKSLVIANLSNKEWGALIRSSKAWKLLVDEFIETNPVFHYKQFDYDMRPWESIACSPDYFCIFNAYTNDSDTTIRYFNATTLTQNKVRIQGDYIKVQNRRYPVSCPNGIFIGTESKLELLSIN